MTAPNGTPLAGAIVTIAGPVRVAVSTDARGTFEATLPPGDFRVEVNKGGYAPAVIDDVAVFIGETEPVAIVMKPASLTSLVNIAAVTTTAGRSLNTTAAAASTVSAQSFTALANPQINDVLQRQPDLVVQKMGSQPDTSIVLGGVQPYETQVLIDGHPISMGQFGVWLSEYFASFLISGVETQTGPGNTTPFASTAVGGTANIVTPGFTTASRWSYVEGVDSYSSQYGNLLGSGAAGKLQYVVGAGYGSSNGPYFQGNHCVFYPQNPGYDNTQYSAGVIQFCGDSSGSLFTKGEVFKVRYNFSQVSSLDLGFVGSQGGFLPQGTAYGNYIGVTKVLPCFQAPNWKPAVDVCTNPLDANLIGKSIDGYVWYPGSDVLSNQPIFTAQLRTSIDNLTLLDRPYAGNIERIVDGSQQYNYPYFWGQPGANFEDYCNNGTGFSGYIYKGTIINGLEECNQTQFNELERDRLYGNTFSASEPFGDSSVTLTWDYHGDNTFAYYNSPSQIATPETTERYNTVSLTGDLALARNLRMEAGLYQTQWRLAGSQPQPGASPPAPLVSLARTTSRFDPHVGLVFQPHGDVAYRFAAGSSETYPFADYVSGEPEVTGGSLTYPNGFVTEKNPFLDPETSMAYDLGGDVRFHDGSLLSLDLARTEVYNVFEYLTYPNYFPVKGQQVGMALIKPINAANLTAKVAKLRYTKAPQVGFGYGAAVAFDSSIVVGVPPAKQAPPAGPTALFGVLPANGQQVCGFGLATPGTPTCIPYFKGYGSLTYAFRGGQFAALGMDFEGKNNAYFQPPFAQFDLTLQAPMAPTLDAQISVQNLLNTNNFYNLPAPGSGVTTVVGNGANGLTQSASYLIPAPPRTLRVQLRWHSAEPVPH
ncbi:MAG TPA: carboxypeptidase regulatory-like domain-containing protein [Verrucomicrobiae bacterium]|nr:carboxypeptidase regulatory-like domain-containing protein [Verrucomicrobiae bacterium]